MLELAKQQQQEILTIQCHLFVSIVVWIERQTNATWTDLQKIKKKCKKATARYRASHVGRMSQNGSTWVRRGNWADVVPLRNFVRFPITTNLFAPEALLPTTRPVFKALVLPVIHLLFGAVLAARIHNNAFSNGSTPKNERGSSSSHVLRSGVILVPPHKQLRLAKLVLRTKKKSVKGFGQALPGGFLGTPTPHRQNGPMVLHTSVSTIRYMHSTLVSGPE